VTGQCAFEPLAQSCEVFDVTPAQVRAELKARAARKEREAARAAEQRIQAFVDAWDNLSEVERVVAARAVGIGSIWDVIAAAIS
jgi:hypothetical protein